MIGLSEVAGLTRQSFYKQKLHSQELLLEKELILQMAHAISQKWVVEKCINYSIQRLAEIGLRELYWIMA